jgi:hypothetical protein
MAANMARSGHASIVKEARLRGLAGGGGRPLFQLALGREFYCGFGELPLFFS